MNPELIVLFSYNGGFVVKCKVIDFSFVALILFTIEIAKVYHFKRFLDCLLRFSYGAVP